MYRFNTWVLHVETDTSLGTVQFMNLHMRPPMNANSLIPSPLAFQQSKTDRLNDLKTWMPYLSPQMTTGKKKVSLNIVDNSSLHAYSCIPFDSHFQSFWEIWMKVNLVCLEGIWLLTWIPLGTRMQFINSSHVNTPGTGPFDFSLWKLNSIIYFISQRQLNVWKRK